MRGIRRMDKEQSVFGGLYRLASRIAIARAQIVLATLLYPI